MRPYLLLLTIAVGIDLENAAARCLKDSKSLGTKRTEIIPSSSGYTLSNVTYGINHVFSSHKDNVININLGQASSQCSGQDCSTSSEISDQVNKQRNERLVRRFARSGTDAGGETILNTEIFNSVWVKNGKGVMQCAGIGCASSTSGEGSIAAQRASSDRVLSPFDALNILFENVTLGEGNIINIGNGNSNSINIGDGVSQCVGDRCSSQATKAWRVSSSGTSSSSRSSWVPFVSSKIMQSELNNTEPFTIILKDLNFGLGNIINIGDYNTISINIGDGASQCIGEQCSSDASKNAEYSSRRQSDVATRDSPNGKMARMPDGVIHGTAEHPYTLIFKDVMFGYSNIINVGLFNENGIVSGDGSSQCVGSDCSSKAAKTFSVSSSGSADSANRSSVEAVRSSIATKTRVATYESVEYPLTLLNLSLGEGNILSFGKGNVLSINIGDGASQCIGDQCSSSSVRSGNFSFLPSSGGSNGSGSNGDGDSNDPMAASDVAAEATSATSALVTWKDADASPPDQSYTVICVPGSNTSCNDEGVSVTNIARGTESATVTGLSPGSSYECWVKMVSVILSDHCSAKPASVTTST